MRGHPEEEPLSQSRDGRPEVLTQETKESSKPDCPIRSQEDREFKVTGNSLSSHRHRFSVLIPPNLSSSVGLAGSQLVNRKGKGMRRSQQT